MSKDSIGILYICTGPYISFWKEFYTSFEEKFITSMEKHYYVFTDADPEDVFHYEKDDLTVIHIDALPWPLITLLRFRYFLTIESKLTQHSMLLFSNANIICDMKVNKDELIDDRHKLFVTVHPGYYTSPIYCAPYERRKASLAYVPYNLGKHYVIGAFFGGETTAFLRLCYTCRDKIEEDLKRRIIAAWDDESHLNRYIINRKDVNYLNPGYCYPFGIDVPYEKKIYAVSKQAKFDVKTFKGMKENLSLQTRIYNKLKTLNQPICFYKDKILCKKLIDNSGD